MIKQEKEIKMKKLLKTLAIILVLSFSYNLTALATKPATIVGYFDNFAPGDENTPTVYCLHTAEGYEPDGFLDGCVVQPVKPGLGEHGTFTGTVDGRYGTCEYNLRTFDLDGIARFAMGQCTGDLAGFQMQGTGWAANGMWEGNYHFEP
jgi:hypothetical protein